MKGTYKKIEDVMTHFEKALAPHEFDELALPMKHPSGDISRTYTAREFIGCSESSLGRRLREMRQQGRVTAKRREGKSFVEYALAPQPAPVAA